MRDTSAQTRLKFAIRLAAAADVVRAHPRDVAALWRGQRAFMGLTPRKAGSIGIGLHGPPSWVADQRERWRAGDVAQLATIQQAARDLLKEHAATGRVQVTAEGRITIDGPDVEIFSGAPLDTFRLRLAWLLIHTEPGRRIRKCPECGRFFIRIRRQLYCRDSCTDAANWRDYSEEKKLAARRKQYERNGWTVGARSKRRT